MYHPNDKECTFPRLCAHRGYNKAAPENTLPAFALAVSMGAQEIELDLWPNKDGDLVVCHDSSVTRTSDGKGLISEMTTKEIKALDAGGWFSPVYKGIKMPLFEEVLDLFGGKVITNIHIKSPARKVKMCEQMIRRGRELSENYNKDAVIMPPLPLYNGEILPENDPSQIIPYSEKDLLHILQLLDSYHCRDYAYICGEADVLYAAQQAAPDIPRCCLEGHMNYTIVDHAIRYDCKKLTFSKGFTTQEMVEKAHAHGITCNIFWSDDAKEAKAFFDAGIDCVLTNNYQPTSFALI